MKLSLNYESKFGGYSRTCICSFYSIFHRNSKWTLLHGFEWTVINTNCNEINAFQSFNVDYFLSLSKLYKEHNYTINKIGSYF